MWRTDTDIQRMVENELDWDPDIEPQNIAVQVNDGVVALAGFARSYMDKFEAEKVAKRVLGVKAVANDIEVKFPSGSDRADPDIARDAVDALKHHLPFVSDKLKTVVRNGWVILEGNVEWDFQRRRAESAARKVRGVKGVTNSIQVKPTVNAVDLKLKIEQALKRSAQVDARNISVGAAGGSVTLGGRVRSWAEKEDAVRTAWRAPGVTDVHNRIEVDTALQAALALEEV